MSGSFVAHERNDDERRNGDSLDRNENRIEPKQRNTPAYSTTNRASKAAKTLTTVSATRKPGPSSANPIKNAANAVAQNNASAHAPAESRLPDGVRNNRKA